MGRVVHFEIHADDPLRAKAFYEELFGWEINPWESTQDYWAIKTGDNDSGASQKWGGIDGGLLRRQGQPPTHNNPVSAFVCTIDVEDINEICKRVVELGGNVMVEKAEMGGVGWLAYCKDTEGNTFGVIQVKPGDK